MFNFLHTFNPEPVLIQFGAVKIHYYGLFIVLGMILGSIIALKLAKKKNISQNAVMDTAFVSILCGILGARAYHVFLELPYYLENPLNILKIWNGGLAIHGGMIAGLTALYFISKRKKLPLVSLASVYVPALALAQAVGRLGNYFNQELYGLPTSLPWGIPINIENRLPGYLSERYYHPAFLYEALGNLITFIVLMLLHKKINYSKDKEQSIFWEKIIIISYFSFYSLLRFFLEFIRIDKTPEILGWRFPQIISLIILLAAAALLIKAGKKAHS